MSGGAEGIRITFSTAKAPEQCSTSWNPGDKRSMKLEVSFRIKTRRSLSVFDFCSFVYRDVCRTSGEQILSGPAHREDSLGFDCEEGCREFPSGRTLFLKLQL